MKMSLFALTYYINVICVYIFITVIIDYYQPKNEIGRRICVMYLICFSTYKIDIYSELIMFFICTE